MIITVYVISDLHGYPLNSLISLFNKASFSQNDTCYVLGDVVDRGADGIKILEWMMQQPNIELVLGNHEAMMAACRFLFDTPNADSVKDLDGVKMQLYLNWAYNGGEITLNALQSLDYLKRRRILEYILKAPLYKELTVGEKRFLLTHSGIENFSPKKPINEYTSHNFLWNRPSLEDTYYNTVITVFGHTPTFDLSSAHIGKILKTNTWINIDCGASFGYKPALLRLDDFTAFYAD